MFTGETSWAGAFLHDCFLSRAARNGTKPGRSKSAETPILHANPEWTSKHWEREPVAVAHESLEEFWRVTGLNRQNPGRFRLIAGSMQFRRSHPRLVVSSMPKQSLPLAETGLAARALKEPF